MRAELLDQQLDHGGVVINHEDVAGLGHAVV